MEINWNWYQKIKIKNVKMLLEFRNKKDTKKI